jgi:hypothetical protein
MKRRYVVRAWGFCVLDTKTGKIVSDSSTRVIARRIADMLNGYSCDRCKHLKSKPNMYCINCARVYRVLYERRPRPAPEVKEAKV